MKILAASTSGTARSLLPVRDSSDTPRTFGPERCASQFADNALTDEHIDVGQGSGLAALAVLIAVILTGACGVDEGGATAAGAGGDSGRSSGDSGGSSGESELGTGSDQGQGICSVVPPPQLGPRTVAFEMQNHLSTTAQVLTTTSYCSGLSLETSSGDPVVVEWRTPRCPDYGLECSHGYSTEPIAPGASYEIDWTVERGLPAGEYRATFLVSLETGEHAGELTWGRGWMTTCWPEDGPVPGCFQYLEPEHWVYFSAISVDFELPAEGMLTVPVDVGDPAGAGGAGGVGDVGGVGGVGGAGGAGGAA